MNLGKTILNVLINQPKVYVEGLGVFSRIYISSKFDERNKIYLPPITYIEFDGESTDGFEFIKYIQSLHHVDQDKARELLSTAVDKVLNDILNHNSVLLEGLGYLIKHGDKAVFKPLDLSGFKLEPISGKDQNLKDTIEEKKSPPIEESGLIETTFVNESVDMRKQNDREKEDENVIGLEEEGDVETGVHDTETEFRSNSHVIRYVAVTVAVAILTVGGYFFYDAFVSKQEEVDSTINISSIEVKTDNDPVKLMVDSLKFDSVNTVQLQLDSLPIIDPYENHKYQIVIGSHKTIEEAEKQAEEFHKKGYSSVRVIPSIMPHNRKKVIWDSYINKSEVDSALRYVKKHFVKDAWPDQIKKVNKTFI